MKPHLSLIIRTDWPTFFCFKAIPTILVCGLALPYMSPSVEFDHVQLLAMTLSAVLVALVCLVWRVMRVYQLFACGRPVNASILLVQLTRNRGRVEFMYDIEGSMRTSWMPVHKTKAVQALVEGQQVEILVHPTHASRAMIARLFC